MHLFMVAALLAVCGAAKLDRTYLPPASAKTAGGSPGAIQAPSANHLFHGNQGLGGIPRGGYSNDVQGVVVDAVAPGTRAAGPGESGLGAPRFAYGSQNSKVGDAAFSGGPFAGFRQQFSENSEPQQGHGRKTEVAQRIGQPSFSAEPVHAERQNAELDRNAEILRLENEVGTDDYRYNFETNNGIRAEENGVATDDGIKAQGAFAFMADDGETYSVTYTADENGYRPQGAHLPTPPPIPEAILKSLEQNAKEEAAGLSDDGSYDAQKYNAVGDYNESHNNGQYNGGSSNKGSGNGAVSTPATFNNRNSVHQSNTHNSAQGNKYQPGAGGNQDTSFHASANSFSGYNVQNNFENRNNFAQQPAQPSNNQNFGYLPPMNEGHESNQKLLADQGTSQSYSQSSSQQYFNNQNTASQRPIQQTNSFSQQSSSTAKAQNVHQEQPHNSFPSQPVSTQQANAFSQNAKLQSASLNAAPSQPSASASAQFTSSQTHTDVNNRYDFGPETVNQQNGERFSQSASALSQDFREQSASPNKSPTQSSASASAHLSSFPQKPFNVNNRYNLGDETVSQQKGPVITQSNSAFSQNFRQQSISPNIALTQSSASAHFSQKPYFEHATVEQPNEPVIMKQASSFTQNFRQQSVSPNLAPTQSSASAFAHFSPSSQKPFNANNRYNLGHETIEQTNVPAFVQPASGFSQNNRQQLVNSNTAPSQSSVSASAHFSSSSQKTINNNKKYDLESDTIEQHEGQPSGSITQTTNQFNLNRNQYTNIPNNQNRFGEPQIPVSNVEADAYVYKQPSQPFEVSKGEGLQNTDISAVQANNQQSKIHRETSQTSPTYPTQSFISPAVSAQSSTATHQKNFQSHVGVTQASASKFTEQPQSKNSQQLPQTLPTASYQQQKYNTQNQHNEQPQPPTIIPQKTQIGSQKTPQPFQQRPSINQFEQNTAQQSSTPQTFMQQSTQNQFHAEASASIASPSQQYNGEIYEYNKPAQTLPPPDSTPQSSILTPTQAAYQETEQRFGAHSTLNSISSSHQFTMKPFQLDEQQKKQKPQINGQYQNPIPSKPTNQFSAQNSQFFTQSQQSQFGIQSQQPNGQKQQDSQRKQQPSVQKQQFGVQNQQFAAQNLAQSTQSNTQKPELSNQNQEASSNFQQQFGVQNQPSTGSSSQLSSTLKQQFNSQSQFSTQNQNTGIPEQQTTINIGDTEKQHTSIQNQQPSAQHHQTNKQNKLSFGGLSQRFGVQNQQLGNKNQQFGIQNQQSSSQNRQSSSQNQQSQSQFDSQFQGSFGGSPKFPSSSVAGEGEYFEPSRQPPSFDKDTGYKY